MASSEVIRWTMAATPVVHLSGEIDVANAADLFACISARLEGAGVVVDLSDVSFIDSCGLAQLIVLAQRRAVRVVAAQGRVPRRVLDMTRLTDLIPTYETVEDALTGQ
jgi:anti-sigma B factor antagonist